MGGGWRRVAQFPYKRLKENDFEKQNRNICHLMPPLRKTKQYENS